MIVICTGCQARFRVADEKIGARGAKVRCTRCQNVFLVQREASPPPPTPQFDLDLTPGLGRPPPPPDPFAPSPPGAAVLPFAATAPERGAGPAVDPFAAAGLDVFGDGPVDADDPFARAAGIVPDAPPAAAIAAEPAGASADPFAPDPFASGPITGSQRLPVTDLAQLLGGAAGGATPPAPPVAPPLASPARPPPGRAFAPAIAPSPIAPAAPAFEPEGPVASDPFGSDLALEERSGSLAAPGASAPAPFADPADVFAADPGLSSLGGEFGSEPGAEESLALATERTPPPVLAPSPTRRPADSAEPAGEVPGLQPVAQDPQPPPAALAAAPARPAEPPAHRVRSAALNALALVALLLLSLAIRAVLRGDAALGPAALRPSTLLQSFGVARSAGPYELVDVRNGVYPQASGSAVLFVRGVVVCHPPAPVEGVRVRAELVRDGQVLSRGEVQAGAVPSPEEVYRAVDHASLEALTAELQSRAPKQVAPGDRLGFLVTLGDAPADLSGTTVRLEAGPDVGAPR